MPAVCSTNRAHLPEREPAQQHALGGALARELGESLRQRMAAAQLDVAIGADQQQASRAQLAREELEQEQRGLVGPVQVVEDDDQRPARARRCAASP